MSIHPSLVTRGKLARERNVWTRLERILFLEKEGKWKDGDTVFGLPKVRTRLKAAAKKKVKKAAEVVPGTEGTVAAPAAAPAAAAKPSQAAAKVAAKEAAAERKKERGGKGAK
jgi:small basic protein (TIGR04137 family)